MEIMLSHLGVGVAYDALDEGGRIVVRFKYEQSIQDAVRALHTE